ncbi:N-6 DNA methylase [Amycolatopsis sp. NPDC047767]|uniref:N-6 DNA methylase n=1 Tax=Amycolatopsis sp. NPDC047767 TaxID=3156765 RepID=UPI0034519EE2
MTPDEHAAQVAAAIDETWHSGSSEPRHDVPISAAATVCLLRPDDAESMAKAIHEQPAAAFLSTARHLWSSVLRARPGLVHLVHPMVNWMFDDPAAHLVDRFKMTVEAALDADQLALTGTKCRYDTDQLGHLLTRLKSRTALRSNAQIYTPPDLALVAAALVLDRVELGQTFCDPVVGTGGLLRAAAQVIRRHGHDPADMVWYGADIDPLAIAATAVNSVVWGLGRSVILYCGDTLSAPNWAREAFSARRDVLRIARDIEAINFLNQL